MFVKWKVASTMLPYCHPEAAATSTALLKVEEGRGGRKKKKKIACSHLKDNHNVRCVMFRIEINLRAEREPPDATSAGCEFFSRLVNSRAPQQISRD